MYCMKGADIIMGGEVLDYEAKRIKNEAESRSNIKAVVNMLVLGNDEQKIRELYPEQFDSGKKLFQNQTQNSQ